MLETDYSAALMETKTLQDELIQQKEIKSSMETSQTQTSTSNLHQEIVPETTQLNQSNENQTQIATKNNTAVDDDIIESEKNSETNSEDSDLADDERTTADNLQPKSSRIQFDAGIKTSSSIRFSEHISQSTSLRRINTMPNFTSEKSTFMSRVFTTVAANSGFLSKSITPILGTILLSSLEGGLPFYGP